MSTSNSKNKAKTSHPFVPSVLEAAANNPSATEYYEYTEDPIRQFDPITDENHDQDFKLKLARLENDSLVRIPT